ncbi:putative ABC transport system ATP-binding protein/lipoprotein-releasing system ATP-binding protein [Cytobacillus firmus]|uniref:Putative ABC transport system ATP-binding protein/lipoprotein-releasing system ATP-binding protein n=2 Tax=Cytobacillus TaxID=2675230 RepID=A0A366JJQ0_CYTFI|nr:MULTISPECIES: ABC transporter ATP-binding protein [Cytobacillus]RBP86587.1 putative ABC transport system ATP-binding protein/lipoprotein-releasing system ATP-binding protein [Cytobacillus firmus]TDX39327.1 putative ABC transport system ATP-binding protein/lipoprotein-releasing system ATP-binding protein [Cytobacillus oceanisediminis]
MANHILLKNIEKHFNNNFNNALVLKNINLLIEEGDFVSIVGPSGSGKSTLLSIIGTLEKPSNGSVIFNEEDISGLNHKKLSDFRFHNIGFVFQQFNLLPTLTSIENVILPTISRRVNFKIYERAKTLLKKMGLEDKLDSLPSQLSGGQQQRVALARAIVNEPAWILADEPTGNLDSKTSMDMFLLLRNLNEEKNCGVIFVTHDRTLAQMSNRIIEINDGEVISDHHGKKL